MYLYNRIEGSEDKNKVLLFFTKNDLIIKDEYLKFF